MPDLDDWMQAKLEAAQRQIEARMFSGAFGTATSETAEPVEPLTVEKLHAMMRSLGTRRVVLVSDIAPAGQLLLIDHSKISSDADHWLRTAFPDDDKRPDIICPLDVWPHLRERFERLGAEISGPTRPPTGRSQFYVAMIPPPKPKPWPGVVKDVPVA